MERQPYTALDFEQVGERQYGIWFGQLGGAGAWLVHLLGSYGIAEFGCVSEWGSVGWLGISHVAWLCIGLTAVTAIVASGALVIAVRCHQRPRATQKVRADAWGNAAWMGMVLSGFFLLSILFESIPIVYYLRDC